MTEGGWPVEDIPDSDIVYYRVHKALLVDGMLRANCFREQADAGDATSRRSMSTDWSKYANPDDTRSRAAGPGDNLVVEMSVGALRGIDELTVRHAPLPNNRAHTDVLGVGRDPEIRDRLREIAVIVLSL